MPASGGPKSSKVRRARTVPGASSSDRLPGTLYPWRDLKDIASLI